MAGVSLLDQVRSLHDAGLMSSVNILVRASELVVLSAVFAKHCFNRLQIPYIFEKSD